MPTYPTPLAVVTLEELDGGFQGLLHVEGWKHGACFHYVSRDDKEYTLRTPRTNRIYRVPITTRLLHTRSRTERRLAAAREAEKWKGGDLA